MGDLPQFIVMKPVSLQTYVCYESDAVWRKVYCRGTTVLEAYTKIEIEPAKRKENLFHLRFCHSNRYLGQCAEDERAIAAESKHPVEDERKQSCTLFKLLVYENGRSRRMQHFRSGLTVFMDEEENTRLSLGNRGDDTERFDYLDWDEFVWIPEHVAFKGHNGKFLRAIWFSGHRALRFEGTDGTDLHSDHVVVVQPDGHFRIKSVYHNGFWRRSPDNWIWADSNIDNGDEVDTLFWPVRLGDQTIALRNEGNGRYVMGLSDSDDVLNARAEWVNEETKLVVEENVQERSVYNVKYHLDDARVFDHEPYSLATASAENHEDQEATLTLEAEEDITIYNTFTRSYYFNLGGEVTFTMGIPFVAMGDQIQVSAEDSSSRAWGQQKTKTRHAKASLSIRVPPRTRATATYVATKVRCTVPFSYTQKARISTDGKYLIHRRTDGIFSALDFYDFRFEAFKLVPL